MYSNIKVYQKSLYASSGPKAEGVPTNNQRGRGSGPCRLWGGFGEARHIVQTALLVRVERFRNDLYKAIKGPSSRPIVLSMIAGSYWLLPGTWSHLWFAGVRECPPWCSIDGATVTVHQFFCILPSCYIPSSLAYDVFISQLIWYARACSSYECFILRTRRLSSKLLKQEYFVERLKSSFRKFYERYGDLMQQYEVSLSLMLNEILTLDK